MGAGGGIKPLTDMFVKRKFFFIPSRTWFKHLWPLKIEDQKIILPKLYFKQFYVSRKGDLDPGPGGDPKRPDLDPQHPWLLTSWATWAQDKKEDVDSSFLCTFIYLLKKPMYNLTLRCTQRYVLGTKNENLLVHNADMSNTQIINV